MRRMTRLWVALAALGLAIPVFFARPAVAGNHGVVVFAAASLKNALDEIAADWTARTGKRPRISYAASSALARQIEQGAPADVFISADLDWMDYLAGRGLIRADTRSNLLGNRLALVAEKGAAAGIEIKAGFDLAAALGGGRLALANVDAVPAGRYARAALDKLGVWQGVKDRTAQADNTRAALLLVSRGEVPLGIVYRTDAAAEPNVRVVGLFPEDTHPPIVYPVAVTTASTSSDAAAFLMQLGSPQAQAAFRKQGFVVLGKPPS